MQCSKEVAEFEKRLLQCQTDREAEDVEVCRWSSHVLVLYYQTINQLIEETMIDKD